MTNRKTIIVPSDAIISSHLYEIQKEPLSMYGLTVDRQKFKGDALKVLPQGKPSRDGTKIFVSFVSNIKPRIIIDRDCLGELEMRVRHAHFENRPLNSVFDGLDLRVDFYTTERSSYDSITRKHHLLSVEPLFQTEGI